MIPAYALLPIAAPFQVNLAATMAFGAVGWAVLASLAIGIGAVVALVAHDRLRRTEGGIPPAIAIRAERRLAA